MSPSLGISRIRLLVPVLDLLLCALGFYAAILIFSPAGADRQAAIAISALASGIAWPSVEGGALNLSLWVDSLFRAVGLNLLAQYGLAYVLGFRPVPLAVTVTGVFSAAFLIALERAWISRWLGPVRSTTVLVGFDSVAAALVPFLGAELAGVVETEPARVPAGLPYLGTPDRLREIVAQTHAVSAVVSASAAEPRSLLDLQYSGTRVLDASVLYESFLGRLRWEGVPPASLLFSEFTNADRFSMAVQSVYTNAIGLALLVITAPVMILLTISVALAAGGGPVFQNTGCLGFQMVPFRLMRFSLRRRDGRPHALAKLLAALHLDGLPQIVNVVRGEMGFFGPPPVRTEIAQRIGALLSVYSHRFTVKPGILGWSQLHAPRTGSPPDEAERLEYDLYYVKQSSLSLDLEILLKTLFWPRTDRAGMSQAAGGDS